MKKHFLMHVLLFAVTVVYFSSLLGSSLDERESLYEKLHYQETLAYCSDNVRSAVLFEVTDKEFCTKVANYLVRLMSEPAEGENCKIHHESQKISLYHWACHILQRAQLERVVLVVALMNLQRMLEIHPEINLTVRNIRFYFLVSCLAASKITDDVTYKNSDWSVISSVLYRKHGEKKLSHPFSLKEINEGELTLIKLLGYSLFPLDGEFASFLKVFMGETPDWLDRAAFDRVGERI